MCRSLALVTDQSSQRKDPAAAAWRVLDARFAFAIAPDSTAPDSDVPEVAFAGRSNVGKSSLMNVLLGRRNLVRTSSTPGCTRQVNVFSARLAGGTSLGLVDLPGFGYAKRSKQERADWASLVEGFVRSRRSLAVLVLLVDARRGVEQEELQLVEFVRAARGGTGPPVRVVGVVTKADKVSRAAARAAVQAMSRALGVPALAFSAHTGEGREAVWAAVARALQG
jgi:GTP-binding protein